MDKKGTVTQYFLFRRKSIQRIQPWIGFHQNWYWCWKSWSWWSSMYKRDM